MAAAGIRYPGPIPRCRQESLIPTRRGGAAGTERLSFPTPQKARRLTAFRHSDVFAWVLGVLQGKVRVSRHGAYAFIDEDGAAVGQPELGLDGIGFPFVPPAGRFRGRRLRMNAMSFDGFASGTWPRAPQGVYHDCYATSKPKDHQACSARSDV